MTNSIKADGIDGTEIEFKVGDYIGFKYDVEQSGKITEVHPASRSRFGGYTPAEVTVIVEDGGYVQGPTPVRMPCDKCWEE